MQLIAKNPKLGSRAPGPQTQNAKAAAASLIFQVSQGRGELAGSGMEIFAFRNYFTFSNEVL